MKNVLNLFQFEKISKIGEGGFGEVFKIKEKSTGNIYAAKVSLKSLDDISADAVRSLAREVSIISKLNHPCIVNFIGYSPLNFKNKKKPVIVTEFLSNGSLNDIINLERKGLSKVGWDDTKKLINIYGIASSMSYLHEHDIIHRDLKPDNVLMDDYLFPKLTDFGLSKIKHSNEESMTLQSSAALKGTPAYVAPEIWETYEYTKAGDVYAFGFIVFEIMTFEEIYKDFDFFSLMTNVLNGIRPEIRGIPDSYKELIEKCWSQNPLDRPTFKEIVDELENNSEFITDLVEKDDYLDYIEFVKEYKTSFDKNKNIDISDFIKRETKTFKKIKIDQELFDKLKKDESEEDDSSEEQSTSSNEKEQKNKTKNDDMSNIIKLKNAELPFELPPESDDPITNKNRQLFYTKLRRIPKDEIPKSIYAYAGLTESGKLLHKNVKEATIFYKIAADLGNITAMWHYAIALNNGKCGVDINLDEADRYFLMAIEKGSVDAMYTHASFLSKREDQASKEKAIHYYKMAVDKGDRSSMTNLGTMYYEGNGTEKDLDEAFKYYKMAADRGEKIAMKNLSNMYKEGESVPVDLEKAFEYCKMSADLGFDEAINNLGVYYQKGIGTEINFKEALKCYQKASEMGYSNGMLNYGSMFNEGFGVEVNYEVAFKYFKMAADMDNTKAIVNLSIMYDSGKSVPVDKEKANNLLKKAIDLGEPLAMRNMAARYKDGNGVPQNLEESFKYMKMAADKGDPEGITFLGWYIQQGLGTEKNPEEAIKYFKKGISLGNVYAMKLYAESLYAGIGVPPNDDEALFYFQMASLKGDIYSMGFCGRILYEKDKNSQEAKNILKTAAYLGDRMAMQKYAEAIEEDECSTIEDYKECIKYSKLSYENGVHFAIHNIGNLIADQKLVDEPELLQDSVDFIRVNAEREEPDAMAAYGNMLRYGNGVPKDRDQSLHYLKKAADKGNQWGAKLYNKLKEEEEETKQYANNILLNIQNLLMNNINQMAQMKQNADNGDVKAMVDYVNYLEANSFGTLNHAEIAKYAKMAAHHNSVEGKYQYGVVLCLGQGVTRNFTKACHYFKSAADEGNIKAMNAYGAMLERGTGVSRYKAKACEYYKKAADQGLNHAMNNYGAVLFKGLIRNDHQEACNYFKAAADNDEVVGMFNYAIMLKNGDGVKVNNQEACRYFKLAADKGDSNAMKEYARMLENGIGIEKNQDEANHYYDLANQPKYIDQTNKYQELNFTQYVLSFLNNYEEHTSSSEVSNDESISSSNELSISNDSNNNMREINQVERNTEVINTDSLDRNPPTLTNKEKCKRVVIADGILLLIGLIVFLIVYFAVLK